MELKSLADEALMKQISARDVEAFRVLYFRYELPIFNFLLRCAGNRALAEDLLQETFWRVWQAARTFNPGLGDFHSWLFRVALNATRSELALKRHSRETLNGIIPEEARPFSGGDVRDDNPACHFERREAETLVADALAGLSPALREVVALRCMEGLKFREIAAVTGAPAGTLKTRFHRAIAELRRRLAPGEE
jgi:RNA polymerase sigma-70 factor (ECF subfamily)